MACDRCAAVFSWPAGLPLPRGPLLCSGCSVEAVLARGGGEAPPSLPAPPAPGRRPSGGGFAAPVEFLVVVVVGLLLAAALGLGR